MQELRNPFRIRTSEHIDSDSTFLRLFSPEVLRLLTEEGVRETLWNRIQFFESAPGGGKTSLFRVFTPNVLRTLYASRNDEPNYKDLYGALASLGAVGEIEGPRLLGVMISCARNYASLEDLHFDSTLKERLLYALLNARIVMAGLRGALAIKGLVFPDDLNRLAVDVASVDEPLPSLPDPLTGQALFDWAKNVECSAFKVIDSFGEPSIEAADGHDTLHAVGLLRPSSFLCDDETIVDRTLLMLDDIHRLTTTQRQHLTRSLAELRVPIGIWLAERLEVLSPEQLLAAGGIDGREYGTTAINLESFWVKNGVKFHKAVMDVGTRRVKLAHGVDGLDTFEGCLREFREGVVVEGMDRKAVQVIRERVERRIVNASAPGFIAPDRYSNWTDALLQSSNAGTHQALKWRALETLVERDLARPQQSSLFAGGLPVQEFDEREKVLGPIAEYLVAREFQLPYYYGSKMLSKLSSWNIEQFLALAGDLFQEVASAEIMQQQLVALDPARQDDILRRHARRRWKELPRRLPHGRDVQNLLAGIANNVLIATLMPTAPYEAVTGVALTTRDRLEMVAKLSKGESSFYRRLVNALSSAVAHNLLEVRLDHAQGKPGQTWTVFYLNRWICVNFGLPVQYGGWRPCKASEMHSWMMESVAGSDVAAESGTLL